MSSKDSSSRESFYFDSEERDAIENGDDCESEENDSGDEDEEDEETLDAPLDACIEKTDTFEIWRKFKTVDTDELSYIEIPGRKDRVIRVKRVQYNWELIMIKKTNNYYRKWDEEIKDMSKQIKTLAQIKFDTKKIGFIECEEINDNVLLALSKLNKKNADKVKKDLSIILLKLKRYE